MDTNPRAGLVSINSAKSCAAWVDIRITGADDVARVESLCEFEPALAAKVDIDQCHVGPQFLEASKGRGGIRRHADDRDALALQQAACGIDETRAVIND